ncbi:MAG: hypothetical protein JXA20_18515 [Spirochaetes bacterium]|nr:hypothetical protein [Spirochaetota bacterium]
MAKQVDYNKLVPFNYRRRMNQQRNILKLDGKYDSSNKILQPYRYVIGLGELHYKLFDREMLKLIDRFTWTKKKHVRFIINELILNSQFSMLREVVRKVPVKKKVPCYFYITIYINDDFISAGIEEFGDFFDYYNYIDKYHAYIDEEMTFEDYFDEREEEHVTSINDLSTNQLKLVLTTDHRLIVPDESNKIALNVIEHATDNDFYITSFFKDSRYMWKRINFRIENIQ